jgi:hypothetical protein
MSKFLNRSLSITDLLIQMYGLMNEVSDMYNKRLLEYADKQEMFNIKEYIYISLFRLHLKYI